jgi:hypothetical protein
MSDEPTARPIPEQLQQRDGGVAEAKQVRLSPNPPPYNAPPRDEPGPEAYPPATIEATFTPIEDIGPATPIPLPQQPKPNDAQDARGARGAQDAMGEPGRGTDLPSDLSGEGKA